MTKMHDTKLHTEYDGRDDANVYWTRLLMSWPYLRETLENQNKLKWTEQAKQ
nr:hypothetical protein [uncultured Flavobacterium sp.]